MKYKIETAERIINDLRSDGLKNKDIAKVLKEALHICGVVQPEANCKITCLITYWTVIDSGHAMIDDYRTKVGRIVEVNKLSDLNDKYNNLIDVKILK